MTIKLLPMEMTFSILDMDLSVLELKRPVLKHLLFKSILSNYFFIKGNFTKMDINSKISTKMKKII